MIFHHEGLEENMVLVSLDFMNKKPSFCMLPGQTGYSFSRSLFERRFLLKIFRVNEYIFDTEKAYFIMNCTY